MRLTFTLHDVQEISGSAYRAFISTLLIKETVNTATEETQCAGLKFFKDITPGEDRSLIATCTEISFWCCCETIKKVSPIIAGATSNLMY